LLITACIINFADTFSWLTLAHLAVGMIVDCCQPPAKKALKLVCFSIEISD
jgi:hypothetical protein